MSERKGRRRIAGDKKYKRDDKRTETRGLTELERWGERKEYRRRTELQLAADGEARSATGKEAGLTKRERKRR